VTFISDPLPSERTLVYTESATVAFEQIVREAALDGGQILVPAFFCRNTFERVFERHDLTPVFVDVDEDTYHIDLDEARPHLDAVDAVLLVHAFGLPAPMDRWAKLADVADFVLIEDCARALGSSYDRKPVGSVGDYAFFSLIKTTPLSFGGILVGSSASTATDIAPPRIDADRLLRTLYSVAPVEFPLETQIARIYDRLLDDDSSTAPEIDDVSPPEADTVHRLDPMNWWLFDRYLRREFETRLDYQASVAGELRSVLSRAGMDLQADAAGRTQYVFPATVAGDRDDLLDYLRARDHAVATVWDDPWALYHPAGGDAEDYPVTAHLAQQVLSFLPPEMTLSDVGRLERDLLAYSGERSSRPGVGLSVPRP
jgi:dTDP-4-amino-4,6-dideoxygalactose transaminase